MITRFKVGDSVRMTPDALENYGQKYAGKSFDVESVSTAYMPAKEFFAKGKPNGFHPGFDESSNCALYDFAELGFSLYDWELSPARNS